MSMQIMCSKGCGNPITVTDEQLREAQAHAVPINVAHVSCPGTPGHVPQFRYLLKVTVVRVPNIDLAPDEEIDDDSTLELIKNGGAIEADSLSEAFPKLTDALQDQWSRASEMAAIAEG